MVDAIFYGGFSGLTIIISGFLGLMFDHHQEQSSISKGTISGFIAFGSGVLLSTIVLYLMPYGIGFLNIFEFIAWFLAGLLISYIVVVKTSSKLSPRNVMIRSMGSIMPKFVLVATIFANDQALALLISILIGFSNLSENIERFRLHVISGMSAGSTLMLFFFASFLGLGAALFGINYLSNPDLGRFSVGMMVLASSASMYFLMEDVLVQKESASHFLGLWTGIGFCFGIVASGLVG